MASTPSFLQKLLRPFSSGTMRLNPEAAAQNLPEGTKKATVANGCFWGTEHMYRREFKGKGLLDARVGYTGGSVENPSYRAVCSGRTGHAEALQIHYDPAQLSYQQLIEFFYRMHDATQLNRQGPDTGPQYRSAIFYHDEEQERIARAITEKVEKEWFKQKVATEIAPAGTWYDAENYHQEYLDHNPGGYECPSHFIRKFPALSE